MKMLKVYESKPEFLDSLIERCKRDIKYGQKSWVLVSEEGYELAKEKLKPGYLADKVIPGLNSSNIASYLKSEISICKLEPSSYFGFDKKICIEALEIFSTVYLFDRYARENFKEHKVPKSDKIIYLVNNVLSVV